MRVTKYGVILLAVVLAAMAAAQTPQSGQNIAPVYEGWEQNADGSFTMRFDTSRFREHAPEAVKAKWRA